MENQWVIRVRKRPEEVKNIEFDIELTANPLLAIYQKEFVKRAILFSQLSINEDA